MVCFFPSKIYLCKAPSIGLGCLIHLKSNIDTNCYNIKFLCSQAIEYRYQSCMDLFEMVGTEPSLRTPFWLWIQWLPSVSANFLSRGSILGLLRFHGILLRLDALRSTKDDTMKKRLGHANYGNLFGIIWVRWPVLFVLLKLDISSSVPAMRL